MCVLCGEFINQVHWTDQPPDRQEEIVVGDLQRERQRLRLHRTHLCNDMLAYHQLNLEEWHGSKYLLNNAKGQQDVIHDLGSLWITVEKMIGASINPLDPSFLQYIRNMHDTEKEEENNETTI